MTSFMSAGELASVGFAQVGADVRISRFARIYGASGIRIGNHVRLDDFSVLSAGLGGIDIGSHVHIAVFTILIGSGNIRLSDFANLSSRVSIYSSSDDFSGRYLTGPAVPPHCTNVSNAPVHIGRHAILGTGSVVLPGVSIGDGAAIGAMSLVKSEIPAFEVHAGCPARKIGVRARDVLVHERRLISHEADASQWQEGH